MLGKIFSQNSRVAQVAAATASGSTAVNSSSVDMAGWEGVVFIGRMDTANAGNSANVAQSSDDSTFNDLAGTKVVPGDNGDSWMIDVYNPTDRYVRCEVDRSGAATALGPIYAIQYGARKGASSHGATIDSETHISPAEGTA